MLCERVPAARNLLAAAGQCHSPDQHVGLQGQRARVPQRAKGAPRHLLLRGHQRRGTRLEKKRRRRSGICAADQGC